jgi:hypothetical protein
VGRPSETNYGSGPRRSPGPTPLADVLDGALDRIRARVDLAEGRTVTVAEATERVGLSPCEFRARYGHLVEHVDGRPVVRVAALRIPEVAR